MTATPEAPRVDVLGVGISAITLQSGVETIAGWITTGRREYVCVTGVHGVMEAQRSPDLLAIHNRSGMTTPDGMPMVWAGRRAGARWMSRVYGPDLMLAVMRRGVDHRWRHFLFGGAPGVADALASRLQQLAPGVLIAGTFSPGYPPEPGEGIAAIEGARPDVVWVGLSTPAQERWMARHRDRLSASVLVGVGAAFDIHAGRVPQAPRWMQRSGLEWAHRLAHEPRRLAGRYLRNNPAFVVAVLRAPPRLRPPGRSAP